MDAGSPPGGGAIPGGDALTGGGAIPGGDALTGGGALPGASSPGAVERAALLAELSTSAAPSLRPASLVSAGPLRPLPVALLAKLEIRQRAGYDAAGPDHPRRERWLQAFYAEVGLAVLASMGLLVLALIGGHSAATAVAGGVLAGSAVTAAVTWRSVQADPLRIGREERRALTAAGFWQSHQPWTAALNAGAERALLGVAVQTAAEIAGSPAWRSGYLDGHRLQLDLADELDAIDEQTFWIAQARHSGGPDADVRAGFDGAVDRVLALREYAAGAGLAHPADCCRRRRATRSPRHR